MTEIHAHNLLNLLRETPMNRDELAAHLVLRHAYTCKLNDLDLDALQSFAKARKSTRLGSVCRKYGTCLQSLNCG